MCIYLISLSLLRFIKTQSKLGVIIVAKHKNYVLLLHKLQQKCSILLFPDQCSSRHSSISDVSSVRPGSANKVILVQSVAHVLQVGFLTRVFEKFLKHQAMMTFVWPSTATEVWVTVTVTDSASLITGEQGPLRTYIHCFI